MVCTNGVDGIQAARVGSAATREVLGQSVCGVHVAVYRLVLARVGVWSPGHGAYVVTFVDERRAEASADEARGARDQDGSR